MATNYLGAGHRRTKTVPTGGATKGDINVTRSGADGECGVWLDSYDAATTGVLLMSGIFSLPKAPGAIAAGARVYWDDASNVVETSATGNSKLGTCVAAATTAATTVQVLINDRPAS